VHILLVSWLLFYSLSPFGTPKKEKNEVCLLMSAENPGMQSETTGFTSPVETAWPGVKTLADLFEQACNQHGDKNLLGTQKIISRETEVSQDGGHLKSFI
jgi:hypothetical protein